MQHSNSQHTPVFSTIPCVCAPRSLLSTNCTFFLCHISLFSCCSNVCYSIFPLIFFYHIFSFCSLPHSVNHLIFLLEICLGYHYSKSCYEGAVCLFLALINIIYQWWITAKKICLFCSTFKVSVSSSKYIECWLFLKVWNWLETLPVEYSYCSFTIHRNCVYVRVHI